MEQNKFLLGVGRYVTQTEAKWVRDNAIALVREFEFDALKAQQEAAAAKAKADAEAADKLREAEMLELAKAEWTKMWVKLAKAPKVEEKFPPGTRVRCVTPIVSYDGVVAHPSTYTAFMLQSPEWVWAFWSGVKNPSPVAASQVIAL